MKLVRNTTSDGSCKYALLRIDKMLKDGEKNPNYWGYVNMRTKQKIGLKDYKPKNK